MCVTHETNHTQTGIVCVTHETNHTQTGIVCVTYETDQKQVLFASHINVIVGVV